MSAAIQSAQVTQQRDPGTEVRRAAQAPGQKRPPKRSRKPALDHGNQQPPTNQGQGAQPAQGYAAQPRHSHEALARFMAAAAVFIRYDHNGRGTGAGSSAAPSVQQPPVPCFLAQGRLHLPSVQAIFGLATMRLDGVSHPTDPRGFTVATFRPGTTLLATGDPLPTSDLTRPRAWLVRVSAVHVDSSQAGSKRKTMQVQQVLGLWTLPPPAQQPRSLVQLAAALEPFLQDTYRTPTGFKYPRDPAASEMESIDSPEALAEALDRFRSIASNNTGVSPKQAMYGSLYFTTVGGQPSREEFSAALGLLERRLVASGFAPWRQVLDRELEAQGAQPEATEEARKARVLEDRHPDGRHKDEVEHLGLLADMNYMLEEMFDGKIADLVEVVDHRHTMCRVCNHISVESKAQSYSTQGMRRHFLAQHEGLLREHGVDLEAWR